VDNTTTQRDLFEAVVGATDGRFILERPALFSPAAAAQDEVNGKSGLHHWAAGGK